MRMLFSYITFWLCVFITNVYWKYGTCLRGEYSRSHRPSLSEFSKTLDMIVNQDLGVRKMQEHLDADRMHRHIIPERIAHDTVMSRVMDTVTTKFKKHLIVLKELQKLLQAMAKNPSVKRARVLDCCKVTTSQTHQYSDEFEYNGLYKARIDVNSMCVEGAKAAPNTARFSVTSDLLTTFKKNRRNVPAAGWQRLHLVGGDTYLYPSVRNGSCSTPDIRRVHWFAMTMPVIDLVIIIDVSIGMASRSLGDKSLLDIAKVIAEQIVNSQNSESKVAVVAFSNNTKLAQPNNPCYQSRVAPSTVFNKRILSEFILNLSGSGNSRYAIGLQTALTILRAIDSTRTKTIVFLTGVMPIETINEVNTVMRNIFKAFPNIHVVTFGIGATDGTLDLLLRNMVRHPTANHSTFHAHIQVGNDILSQLTPLYKYFYTFTTNVLRLSTPSRSTLCKEVVWTVSRPVFDRNQLLGVVAVDIFKSQWMDFENEFRQTKHNYIFIADTSLRYAVFHPSMSWPQVSGQPTEARLSILEKEATQKGIIDDMINNYSGNKTISVVRKIPSWNVFRAGFHEFFIPAVTYYWKQSRSTPLFTVCIVITDSRYFAISGIYRDDIPLGNIQLMKGVNLCNHFYTCSIIDDSAVWWSPAVYVKPTTRLAIEETLEIVQAYSDMITGRAVASVFKERVVDHIQLSYIAHRFWMNNMGSSPIIRRYIALESGITRGFPGTWNNRNYNPVIQGWYIAAASFPDFISISLPHLDILRAGIVITLSKAIVIRIAGRSTVIGVMGIDLTLRSFRARLEQRFVRCRRDDRNCFVIDGAGYMVLHNDMLIPPRGGPPPRVQNIHITTLEPQIAYRLIQLGLMESLSCHDLRTMHKHYVYNIVSNTSVNNSLFEMAHVTGSNIYIIVRKKDGQWRDDAPQNACVCQSRDDVIPVCIANASCQCPCYVKRGDFLFCENEFSTSNWTICENYISFNVDFATAKKYETAEQDNKYISSLPKCFSYRCERYKNRTDCNLISGCQWCVTDKLGKDLENAFCGKYYTCFLGEIGYASPYNVTSSSDDLSVTYCGPLCSVLITVGVCASIVFVVKVVESMYSRRTSKRVLRRSLQIAERDAAMWNRLTTVTKDTE